ncbi:MAG: hydrogenase iron-sulfur subunit [Anaerolineales bacterium]|nr:hydrogenase iron-sulfur subunit [Anaerolineales bacterium]
MSYEPKIVAFLCSWCSYTGADTAGIARMKSPANLRTIRVPCSGRVAPEWIMRAFDQGADGVLVLGCHIGECHYDSGNHRAAKRIPVLQQLMAYAGLEKERLHLDWVSASEGERYSRITTEFTERIRALGPVRWRVEGNQWEALRQAAASIDQELPTVPGILANPSPPAERFTQEIQQTAHDLLANGEVSCVIGYEVGPRGRTRPAFIYRPDEAQRLVWNQDCTHNLTTYLSQKLGKPRPGQKAKTEKPARVAVVVKACDSRAINMLMAENHFEREQVHVIGVVCEGIRQGAGFDAPAPGPWKMQDRCLECYEHTPVVYDTLIGEVMPVTGEPGKPSNMSVGMEALQNMSPSQRMEFWLSQFDRCIRCYACRQACPMCDCPTCLYERDDSLWVGMGVGLNEKRTFHLGRAYHLAGRCIGCDECMRVCPMNIPIGLLNRMLAQEMQSQFGYRAGLAAVPAPFTTILGGEEEHA